MVFSYILTFVNNICKNQTYNENINNTDNHHYINYSSVLKHYKNDYEQCLKYEPYYMCYQKYKRLTNYKKNFGL